MSVREIATVLVSTGPRALSRHLRLCTCHITPPRMRRTTSQLRVQFIVFCLWLFFSIETRVNAFALKFRAFVNVLDVASVVVWCVGVGGWGWGWRDLPCVSVNSWLNPSRTMTQLPCSEGERKLKVNNYCKSTLKYILHSHCCLRFISTVV